jgi:archaellum component FlaG (FlaF/FlaG flagellin family)
MKKTASLLAGIVTAIVALSTPAHAFQNIVVSPASFNFGAVKIDSQETYTLWVQNTGDEDINFVTVFANGDPGQFSYRDSCSYLPRYSSCTVTIRFNPSREGRFSMNVNVHGGIASGYAYIYGEGVK